MGNVTMQGVQKILHLDVQYPDFATWEEFLDFKVDGVQFKAIATHKWREDTVRIIEPFQVEGDVYQYSCRPPLMVVRAAMVGRRKSLADRGLTVHHDCIRMATGTYRQHSTYLRLKPEIDWAQEAFSSAFRDELENLFNADTRAQEHFRAQKLELRRKLHDKQIEPKPYQETLAGIKKEAEPSHEKYLTLQSKIARELGNILRAHIERALKVNSACR